MRSHALTALGKCGLALVAPLLRDALTATDPMEATAAERGLESLARTVGAEMLATVFADEKRQWVLARKENIYRRLKEPESQTRKPRATRRLTSSRPKRRT